MKKILVIQHKMIGDVLTSTIILETLRKNFPDAELHYLINKNTTAVVENNPFIDKLIIFTPKETKFTAIKNSVKNEKYDVVIDVYSKMNSGLITFFSNAPVTIGIYKNYLKFFYTHIVKNLKVSFENIPLAYENRFNLLKPLKIQPNYTVVPKIYLTHEEKNQVAKTALQNNVQFGNQDYLMVNILGSDISKTYPASYMAKFLDLVAKRFPEYHFLLNYIPSQQEEVNAIITLCSEKTKQHINPYYAPNLRDFIVLTSFCKAVIGNEGGAINIGKALGIPTFAIFSPWIRIETWGSSQNKNHQNIHLKNYKPELFKNYKQKEFKKRAKELYQTFHPELFIKEFEHFINKNINK